MKITYYGTAASEGWPAPFCMCEACRKARKNRGKDLRTRSQALVNGDLLLDFPPDTYDHVLRGGLDLCKVEDVLVTHSHPDHFYAPDLCLRAQPYALGVTGRPLQVWGNARVHALFQAEAANNRQLPAAVTFHEVNPFEWIRTDSGYEIFTLKADHMTTEDALLYVIRKNGKTLLYAHDTGVFPDETWKGLTDWKFDLVSLDCTALTRDWRSGHLGFAGAAEVLRRMRALGCITDETRLVISHLAHTENLCHEDIVRLAEPMGLTVAWDGMQVEF